MNTRRHFVGLILVLTCLFGCRVDAQTQSIEIAYGNGMGTLRYARTGLGAGLVDKNSGYVTYRLLGKRAPNGFSAGLEFSGYNFNGSYLDGVGASVSSAADIKSAYFAIPLMMNIVGKHRVKFVYNIGCSLLFSMQSHYSYFEGESTPGPYGSVYVDSFQTNYKFKFLQMGLPVFGFGIQINLPKSIYLRITAENGYYFDAGSITKSGITDVGLFDCFIAKLAIGCVFSKKQLWRIHSNNIQQNSPTRKLSNDDVYN